MDDILKSAETLFSELDTDQKELLLDAVSGFRTSIASLSASPTLAKKLETLVKKQISAFILAIIKALQIDGPKRLFEDIAHKSKHLCPKIIEALNGRFQPDA